MLSAWIYREAAEAERARAEAEAKETRRGLCGLHMGMVVFARFRAGFNEKVKGLISVLGRPPVDTHHGSESQKRWMVSNGSQPRGMGHSLRDLPLLWGWLSASPL